MPQQTIVDMYVRKVIHVTARLSLVESAALIVSFENLQMNSEIALQQIKMEPCLAGTVLLISSGPSLVSSAVVVSLLNQLYITTETSFIHYSRFLLNCLVTLLLPLNPIPAAKEG